MSWEERAKTVVGKLCKEEFARVNTKKNGQRYKKHRPYVIPETAQSIINALNSNDEELTKALILFSYECRNM